MTQSKTMAERSEHSDVNVTTVDVRNPLMAEMIVSGRTKSINKTDVSVSGTTDMALVTVGAVGVALEFEMRVLFNGGQIGDSLTLTADAGESGKAKIVVIDSLSDEQIAYMTTATITCTTTNIPDGNWSVYLVKKVVLG